MKYIGAIALSLLPVICMLVQLVWFVPNALAATASDNSQTFGIAAGNVIEKNSASLNAEFAGISKLGFKWVRFDFYWSNIQPNSSPNYNWKNYDNIVDIASKNNLKILGILDYSAPWASDSNCKPGYQCGTTDYSEYANFASATAAHFKGKVNDWEIWNEENIDNFWSPMPSAEGYANLLKSAYPAIKKVNSNSFVVLGGLSDTGTSGSAIDPVQFLLQLYNDGAGHDFDAIGYHPYTYPTTALDPNNGWSKMDDTSPSLRSVMIAHGDSAKQIWATEYGAPTNGPVSNQFVGENAQAQEALFSYIASQGKSWLGPLFWYTYQDSGTSTNTNENFYGLIRTDGSKKESYRIWKQLLSD